MNSYSLCISKVFFQHSRAKRNCCILCLKSTLIYQKKKPLQFGECYIIVSIISITSQYVDMVLLCHHFSIIRLVIESNPGRGQQVCHPNLGSCGLIAHINPLMTEVQLRTICVARGLLGIFYLCNSFTKWTKNWLKGQTPLQEEHGKGKIRVRFRAKNQN